MVNFSLLNQVFLHGRQHSIIFKIYFHNFRILSSHHEMQYFSEVVYNYFKATIYNFLKTYRELFFTWLYRLMLQMKLKGDLLGRNLE